MACGGAQALRPGPLGAGPRRALTTAGARPRDGVQGCGLWRTTSSPTAARSLQGGERQVDLLLSRRLHDPAGDPATPPGADPYPNTGMRVIRPEAAGALKISGKEVMLKNKSYFKSSSGDEAGVRPKRACLYPASTGESLLHRLVDGR